MSTDVTDQEIRSLQRAAEQADDAVMVLVCRLACGDDDGASAEAIRAARAECARRLAEAELLASPAWR